MEKEELENLQKKVTALRAEGKYKETIESGYQLLHYGTELSDSKSVLIAHLNNAASYYCIGDIEAAFNSIDAYDEICREHGDETDRLNRYNVLFLLYEYNKDFPKCKETLEKSIALGKKLQKYNIISNGYSNYSHVYLAEENFAAALEMGKQGLEMAKLHQPASPILELRVKLNIAQAYIGIGDFNAAFDLIREMIEDPILDSFIREKAECSILQGSWYSKQKRYREAYESLTQAKELVESYQDVYLLKTIQEERCQLCEQMGDVQLGYLAQKEYISLLKEINERELALTALKLDVKHSLTTIKKKANTDYLTGLFNRSYLETQTNEWLKKAALTGDNTVCIAFDVDHFKFLNDQFGHLFGDEVIKQVGTACLEVMEESDLFGRFGGDEFVVILKGAFLEEGKKKAERLEEVIRSLRFNNNGNEVTIHASLGVADNSKGTAQTFQELFHRADLALYEAKRNGRNQIYVKD